MEDLIKPHFPNMTETKAIFLSKGLGETSVFYSYESVLLPSLDQNHREEPALMTHVLVLPSLGLRPGVSGDGLRGLSDGLCAAGTCRV